MDGPKSSAIPSDQNRGNTINALNGVFLGLGLILVCLRVYVRTKINKTFGWDDFLIILALVSSLISIFQTLLIEFFRRYQRLYQWVWGLCPVITASGDIWLILRRHKWSKLSSGLGSVKYHGFFRPCSQSYPSAYSYIACSQQKKLQNERCMSS